MELKPCPFCGSEAATTYSAIFGFLVYCTNDDCFMSEATMSDKATEQDAIEAWNRRVNDE